MSIGAGIFGFIQGAADAGTRIAALNLEEEKQKEQNEQYDNNYNDNDRNNYENLQSDIDRLNELSKLI